MSLRRKTMKKTIWALAFVLTPLLACSAESTDQESGEETLVTPSEEGVSSQAVLACGNVVLDYCRDPRFPSQVTASCHTQNVCSCANEAFPACQSLVNRY